MARPSVLFINRVYPPSRGASGRVLQELARSFVKKGWDVSVLTTGEKGGKSKDGPIKIFRIRGPEKPKSAISYAWILARLYMKGRFLPKADLVVTMTDPPLLAVVGQKLADKKKARHIHWCQDIFPDILPALGVSVREGWMEFGKAKVRDALMKTEKIVVVGRCMARTLTNQGIDPRKITVIPNWPNFELVRMKSRKSFAEVKQDIEKKNRKSGHQTPQGSLVKSPMKFRVLYAGNLGLAHPVGTIIEAAAKLQKEHPEIEFVFVGDGPRFDHIAQQRSQRELDNIRLMPYQPASHLRQIMESGDLHLISMRNDVAGYLVPSKLYSALAVQRPCILIGPEQTEVAKVIHDFSAGEIVRQGDADALVAAIKKYRLDSNAWFAAHDGAARAGQKYVPNESIKAWIKRANAVVAPANSNGPQKKKTGKKSA